MVANRLERGHWTVEETELQAIASLRTVATRGPSASCHRRFEGLAPSLGSGLFLEILEMEGTSEASLLTISCRALRTDRGRQIVEILSFCT